MQFVELALAACQVILAFFKQIPAWIKSGQIDSLEKERERLRVAKDACTWAKFLGK
jgi:uncharacterized protein YifN (PemK superfamily)